MKAPVKGIFVLLLAPFAHDKGLHGRKGPVVGKGLDYCVSWPAVGAVCKGVTMASVHRVKYFIKAVFAGGNVRGNLGCHPATFAALYDSKIPEIFQVGWPYLNRVYAGKWRTA